MKKKHLILSILLSVIAAAALIFYIATWTSWQSTDKGVCIDIVLKLIVDACLIGIAAVGTKYNPRKRNKMILFILACYMVANSFAVFNLATSGFIYMIGHLFLIYNLVQTSRIKTGQKIAFPVTLVVCLLIAIFLRNRIFNTIEDFGLTKVAPLPLLILAFAAYIAILICKFTYSFNNRYYIFGAILFLVGDVTGFFRISGILPPTPYFDLTCYELAVLLYATSTFNCQEKEVVTYHDVLSLDYKFRKSSFWYCIYGEWSWYLSAGRYTHQSDCYKIAVDVTQLEQLKVFLSDLNFEIREDRWPVEARLFNEKYGNLTVHCVKINEDGTLNWLKGDSFITLDEEIMHEQRIHRHKIPCMFPVANEEFLVSESKDISIQKPRRDKE